MYSAEIVKTFTIQLQSFRDMNSVRLEDFYDIWSITFSFRSGNYVEP